MPAIRNPGVYLIKSNPLLAYRLARSRGGNRPVRLRRKHVSACLRVHNVFRLSVKLRGVIMAFETGERGIKCDLS